MLDYIIINLLKKPQRKDLIINYCDLLKIL